VAESKTPPARTVLFGSIIDDEAKVSRIRDLRGPPRDVHGFDVFRSPADGGCATLQGGAVLERPRCYVRTMMGV
jgi:hypothetical protein